MAVETKNGLQRLGRVLGMWLGRDEKPEVTISEPQEKFSIPLHDEVIKKGEKGVDVVKKRPYKQLVVSFIGVRVKPGTTNCGEGGRNGERSGD